MAADDVSPARPTAADRVDPDAVLALAADLLRRPDAAEPGGAAAEVASMQQGLAERIRSFGWDVTLTTGPAGQRAIAATIDGTTGGRTLVFHGRAPVPAGDDRESRPVGPAPGDVTDGFICGSGSADAGALAAMVAAARAVQQRGFRGRMVIVASVDGSPPEVPAGVDGLVIAGPSAGTIGRFATGVLRIEIRFRVAEGSGAAPRGSDNPIPALGQLLVGVSELERQLRHSVADHARSDEFAVTPTVISAGDPALAGEIPASASVVVDIRTLSVTPHRGLLQLLGRLAEQIADESGLVSHIDVIDDRPPPPPSVASGLVSAFAAAHRHVTGAEPVIGRMPSGRAGPDLPRDAPIETVCYGPGDARDPHGPAKRCAVRDIVTAARVYAEAAEEFLAVQP